VVLFVPDHTFYTSQWETIVHLRTFSQTDAGSFHFHRYNEHIPEPHSTFGENHGRPHSFWPFARVQKAFLKKGLALVSLMDRKDFFSTGLKQIARDLSRTPVGKVVDTQLQGLANLLDPIHLDRYFGGTAHKKAPSPVVFPGAEPAARTRRYSRPPGAVSDPRKFQISCNTCGDCIVACPYGAIFQLNPETGAVMEPNIQACHLCEDWPCIEACEPGALQPLPAGVLPHFGTARVRKDLCLNHPIKRDERKEAGEKRLKWCAECEKACPLMDVVLYSDKKLPDISAGCTGCGICVKACPERAIEVFIS
jgi:ferredoxin-type protein NapG